MIEVWCFVFFVFVCFKLIIILEDVIVFCLEIVNMVKVINVIVVKYDIFICIFGYVGDGNFYLICMIDIRNEDEMECVE